MNQAPLVVRFLQHRDALLGFILALTRDRDAAEEVFQEVGVAILGEAARGTNPDNFLAWAREVARRRVSAWYRERGHERGLAAPPESLAELIDRAFQENERALEQNQLRFRFLGECLERLADRARRMIEQRYRLGRSIADIAGSLGWKPESVKVALSRARKQLGECIQNKLRLHETA